MSRNATWPACGLAVLLAFTSPQGAEARSSDRNEEMVIEAGQTTGTLDDSTPMVLSGGVTIDQGTLHVQAAKAVLDTAGGEVSSAVLTGEPAQLEQELDDGTPITAVADRIDYNMRTGVVVLTGDVFIQQPRNSLRGERVVYNMRTGQLTSGGEGAGRVRMRILPKNADGQAAEPTGDVSVGKPVVAPPAEDANDADNIDETADDAGGDDGATDPAEGG